jgi:hypothetical protein
VGSSIDRWQRPGPPSETRFVPARWLVLLLTAAGVLLRGGKVAKLGVAGLVWSFTPRPLKIEATETKQLPIPQIAAVAALIAGLALIFRSADLLPASRFPERAEQLLEVALHLFGDLAPVVAEVPAAASRALTASSVASTVVFACSSDRTSFLPRGAQDLQ